MDNNMFGQNKEAIRKEIIKRLRDQDSTLRQERSLKIQEKLLASEEFKNADTVMTYVSLLTEVSTSYLIEEAMKQGKRILVPYLDLKSDTIIASELSAIEILEKGPFGIEQSKEEHLRKTPLEEIDLIVVPAIAFDKKNMRLGRGKGCYDKFLASEKLETAKTIGLAFNFQLLESLPVDPHDRPVSRVITD
ncbi:MAG: 5-formyltetrahydrofolate cyclo-ligase [Candidatus Omnitrophica bacterium]|nr:5-formyltetrahydrofolate cyclo-ligase [Candidatus Omnitrophota bacterium]